MVIDSIFPDTTKVNSLVEKMENPSIKRWNSTWRKLKLQLKKACEPLREFNDYLDKNNPKAHRAPTPYQEYMERILVNRAGKRAYEGMKERYLLVA